jgi:hypothetical protein
MVKANRQKLLVSEIDHVEFWSNWREVGRAMGITPSLKRVDEYGQYMENAIANFEAESLFIAFEKADMEGWKRYVQDHPPTPEALAVLMLVAVGEANKSRSKKAADKGHDKPDGSRDKKQQIRDIWASGKYKTKVLCAEEEYVALEVSFDKARRDLSGAPDPSPWPAKPCKKG